METCLCRADAILLLFQGRKVYNQPAKPDCPHCKGAGVFPSDPASPDPEPSCSETPSSERPEKRSPTEPCHAGSIICLPGLSVVMPADESEPVVFSTHPEKLGLLGDVGPAPPPEPSSSQE